MTRAQKFEEVFGLKIDTDGDCTIFDCSGKRCIDCEFTPDVSYKDLGMARRNRYKEWWNAEYKERQ